MKKIVIAALSIIILAVLYYFSDFASSKNEFLEITNYEIIQKDGAPLFLSVEISGNIPDTATNYGYGWLGRDSSKLSGYITNIHADSKWHTESIAINDSDRFCFDGIENVQSNVVIKEDKINVILEQYDFTDFDRVVSYEIVKDDSCKLGYAGIIIDEFKIK